jgi:biotin carboxylase
MVTDMPLTWQREYIDLLIATNPYSTSAVAAIRACMPPHSIDVLTTYDERAVPSCAAIAEELGLPGNSYRAAVASRNKFVMRTHFAAAGLPCPRFALARSVDEAGRRADEVVGYPLVVKPLMGFASQGVLRVDVPAELPAAVQAVQRVSESHRSFLGDDPRQDGLLLEEYMSGYEAAVDGVITRQGEVRWIGIFDKPEPLEGPTFEETIYVTPSEHSEELQSAIFEEVRRGIQALGLTTGAVHAEVRLTDGGPRLLEIAARPIGGICGRAYSYCLGLDYNEIVLKNALGERIDIEPGSRTPSGVMMLPSPGVGRLVQVHGVERAKEVDGVRDVLVMARPQDVIRRYPEQSCYLGFIVAVGPTTHDVRRSLISSHALLRFELEPIPTYPLPHHGELD